MNNLVTIFCTCYNDEVLLPYLIKHYRERFPDCRIVVHDNESTDNSVKIALEAGCEVRTFYTNNQFSEKDLVTVRNNCWKDATTPWVIVCDVDELMEISGKELEGANFTLVKGFGYNICNRDNVSDYSKIRLGVRLPWSREKFESMDKVLLFNREKIKEINYGPGSHTCDPVGDVIYSKFRPLIYHMKYLNEQFLVDRYKLAKSRLSQENIEKNFGTQYHKSEKEIREEYRNCLFAAKIIEAAPLMDDFGRKADVARYLDLPQNGIDSEEKARAHLLAHGVKERREYFRPEKSFEQGFGLTKVPFLEKICLATVSDKSFLPGLEVMVLSFVKNNPWFNGDIVVLTNELEESDIKRCKKVYQKIILKKIDESKYKELFEMVRQFSGGPVKPHRLFYAKFEIFCLGYDRVIYLDSDMLVLGDIRELFEKELDIGLVMELVQPHFNAGLIVIGKKYLNGETARQLIDFAKRLGPTTYSDQDVINSYFDRKITPLPFNYNVLKDYFKHDGSWVAGVKVLHFIKKKPWEKSYSYTANDIESKKSEFLDRYWLDYEKMLPK